MSKKRHKITPGDVLCIDLGDSTYAFGRVLRGTVAFYDLRTTGAPSIESIASCRILFRIWVMDYAIEEGDWPVVGHLPLAGDLLEEPLFFKRDPISSKLSIYRDSTGEDRLATAAECRSLECAAVWTPEHVLDRLHDHFAGRQNQWLESMRVKDDE